MISLQERTHVVMIIYEAIDAGCALIRACQAAGINRRTFQRWTVAVVSIARPEALLPELSNGLCAENNYRLLDAYHETRIVDTPTIRIMSGLAHEGTYLGSESRDRHVLHDTDKKYERSRARQLSSKQASFHCATDANQLWCWDVTLLPSTTRGIYFHLYMIMDVWSCKIVGHEVYESKTGEGTAELLSHTILSEVCCGNAVVIHSDNAAPQRPSTLRVKLDNLGLRTSYTQPRVPIENTHSKSLFCTTEYRHDCPTEDFQSVETARVRIMKIECWNNSEHRHSAFKFVTPAQHHDEENDQILSIFAKA